MHSGFLCALDRRTIERRKRLSMQTIPEAGTGEACAVSIRIAAITADADGEGDRAYVERAIASLLRVVREQLGLEVVFVGEFVGGQRVFRHITSRSQEAIINVGDSHPIDETICQRIVDGRMPGLVADVRAVRERNGLLAYYDAIGAHVGVPVRFVDGSLYGMLCGFSFESRPDLTERDMRRLQMAADAAARLLAQADGLDVGRSIDTAY